MANEKSPYQIDREMSVLAGKIVADSATKEDWRQWELLTFLRRQTLVNLSALPRRRSRRCL